MYPCQIPGCDTAKYCRWGRLGKWYMGSFCIISHKCMWLYNYLKKFNWNTTMLFSSENMHWVLSMCITSVCSVVKTLNGHIHIRVCVCVREMDLECCSAYDKHPVHFSYYYSNPGRQSLCSVHLWFPVCVLFLMHIVSASQCELSKWLI